MSQLTIQSHKHMQKVRASIGVGLRNGLRRTVPKRTRQHHRSIKRGVGGTTVSFKSRPRIRVPKQNPQQTKGSQNRSAAAAVVVEDTSRALSPALMQDSEAVADAKEAVADPKPSEAADCPTGMTWTQFVVANKRLCREEIDSILSRQWKPFDFTDLYKDMIEDSSTTKEDLEREAADHKYREDKLSVWRDKVRKEYMDKAIFAVDDDYIAERLEMEEYYNQSLREMLSELNLDDSIFSYEGLVIKTRTDDKADLEVSM